MRVRWPEGEVPVDAALVRRLLEDQHPDLADAPLLPGDAGWDNVIWRLGDDLAVRIPRRAVAAPLIAHEQRWLPGLAANLPLAVPVPVRTGRPTGYYPWPWSVIPWIPGEPGDRMPVTDVAGSAARLGGFLRVMHVAAPLDAPDNPARSGSIRSRADTFENRLEVLSARVDGDALRTVWDGAVASPVHAGPGVWLHGDLHPANTLVRDGIIVAVIDFGDVCAGDPACDLGAALMSFGEHGAPDFQTAYGLNDPALWHRSLGWCVLFALMLLEIGLEGRPTYARVGRETLGWMARLGRGRRSATPL